MEIQQAIFSRRTIHSFNREKVSSQIIYRAINAANQAPCHRLTFPWRFTSLNSKDRGMIADLAIEMKFGDLTINENAQEKIKSKILTCSHLLVVSQIIDVELKKNREDYAACACAIQNLSLSLSSDHVGCKWSTGMITTNPRTYEIANVNPEIEEIIGFLFIGYGEIPTPIKRLPIELIFREK